MSCIFSRFSCQDCVSHTQFRMTVFVGKVWIYQSENYITCQKCGVDAKNKKAINTNHKKCEKVDLTFILHVFN